MSKSNSGSPYPSYKDSGIEWIGEIPQTWSVEKLKHIACVNLSNVDKKSKEDEQDVRLCNYVDVYYNDFITPDIDYMAATASSDQIKRFSLRQGDVLVTKDSEDWNDIAVPAYVPQDYDDVVCGYHLAHIRPDTESIHGRYLFRSFNANPLYEQFKVSANGITRYGVGKYSIENSLFLLPSADEQQAISDFLDYKTAKIDRLIATKRRQIELLKEQRQAVINQAVTKGLDPNVEMKDSGIKWLGEIPKHWAVSKMKWAVSKIGSGVTPRGGSQVYQETGIPLLRSQNVHFDGLRLNDVACISEEIHRTMKRSAVKKGDVLLNITGASIGRCAYVTEEMGEANVNQHVCILRPNEKISTPYLHCILSSDLGQDQVFISQMGTSREGLNFEQLGNFVLLLPPVDEQHSITEKLELQLNETYASIEKCQKQIDLLEEYRTALISEAVTGKIDVRGWAG